MGRRILVTGANGFVGTHLCRHLTELGDDVVGGIDTDTPTSFPAKLFDLRRADSVSALVEWAGALDAVVHLAAIAFVPDAHGNPIEVMDVNLQGTLRLIDAVRTTAPKARILFVSSSEVYGKSGDLPVTESHPFHPGNPYAISKAAADRYCTFVSKTTDADIVCVRPFNHSGPGQSDRFVLSSFARQLADMEAGLRKPILHVGNLAAARDFSHVGDIVRAYSALLDNGASGEAYNLCSGASRLIQECLDALLGMVDVDVSVEVDENRLRTTDTDDIFGSHAKLTDATGWQPAIPFEQLLEDLLEYWRAQCRANTTG